MVLSGTTGESPTLSFEEKEALFRGYRCPGRPDEHHRRNGLQQHWGFILLTKAAEKAGVDGIMLVAPIITNLPRRAVPALQNCSRADFAPIMVYNVPGRTSSNILPETVARLAEIENIVAIKEASGDLEQVSILKTLVPEDFLIYSGMTP